MLNMCIYFILLHINWEFIIAVRNFNHLLTHEFELLIIQLTAFSTFMSDL